MTIQIIIGVFFYFIALVFLWLCIQWSNLKQERSRFHEQGNPICLGMVFALGPDRVIVASIDFTYYKRIEKCLDNRKIVLDYWGNHIIRLPNN